jgi:predicted phosphoribosyltransferase
MLFNNREDAGKQLAERLAIFAGRDVLVLALPRGGVPVAKPVADRLGAELDVMLVRKLGVPGHEELALGAIAFGGARVLNQEAIDLLSIPPSVVDAVAHSELQELSRRAALYRGRSDPPRISGRTVIVVDDGLATGSTARAALEALRPMGPRELVLAVPVAPPSTLEALAPFADKIECLASPEPFYAVGLWYRDFSQVSDDEVRALLSRPSHEQAAPGP